MKFSEFAKYLFKLESTPKRLEIKAHLVDLLKNISPEEVDKAINLSLGYLKAPYEGLNFNMAERMMLRVLQSAYLTPQAEDLMKVQKLYSQLGDLGNTAYEIAQKASSKVEIPEVYETLYEVAKIEGSGSQELKVKKLAELLNKLSKLSAKYVVRIVLGTTRLGFSELTVLDALTDFLGGDKKVKEAIESVYNIHPDIGLISKKIKTEGLKGIKDIKIETGVPILAQKCQRLSSIEEISEKMGCVWAEFKFDGMRVQLHMDRKKKVVSKESEQKALFEGGEKEMFIKTYTRNQEETTHQFPDIIEAAKRQLDADSVIIDGEAIGYDKTTGEFLPLQETMHRKRKHEVAEIAKNIPLRYFVFDILYLNGKPVLDKPLSERRAILTRIIKPDKTIEVAPNVQTEKVDDLAEFFETAKEKNLEGIIAKKPDAPYQAGARSFAWVKLKKADTKFLTDTVDCVILGYYFGRGVRSKFGIGGFLVGVYDPETDGFKTVSRVGTGLKDEDFIYLKKEADKIKIKEKPANVEIVKRLIPHVWVEPKIVVELGADELTKSTDHTAGYALRFPRLIKFRTDKSAEDATNVDEIVSLYKSQKRGYYNS